MTRKETVKMLRKIQRTVYLGNRKFQDAIEFAIEALSQPEPHWIPFHKRPLTEEEQKEHKDWCWILDCELPDDNQEVLRSSPYFGVYIDTFYNDGECSFDGGEEINDGMAWMPLPERYREEGEEE